MEHPFAMLFVLALALSTATRLWLAARQVRHVRAHRAAVPASFADTISLASHQKAADYTVAKTRLGMLDVLLSALIALALTLDRKSTRLNSSHSQQSRMPSSA